MINSLNLENNLKNSSRVINIYYEIIILNSKIRILKDNFITR